MYDEGICLSKAAKIIHKDLFNSSMGEFSGFFSESCQHDSITQSLMALVSMIVDGSLKCNIK